MQSQKREAITNTTFAVVERLAENLVCMKEDILRAAITFAIKTSDWATEEIIPRCSVMTAGKTQVVHFDDKPLVQFFPAELDTTENEDSVMASGSQKYRMLWTEGN